MAHRNMLLTELGFGGLMEPLTEFGKPELDQTYEVQ
jgi:hypothetical protein